MLACMQEVPATPGLSHVSLSRPSGLPDGIKDMVPLLFTIFDENLSPFLRPQNMAGVAEPATEEEKGEIASMCAM